MGAPFLVVLILLFIVLLLAPLPARSLSQEETDRVIRNIDEMERSGGDYKALAYMEAKEKDKK